MQNHFNKSLKKAGLRSPKKATERGWSEPFYLSTGPGPFLLKFQVGWRESWTAQNGMLGLGLWLTGGWKAAGVKAANRWVLNGV